ncbi:hypothetical protein [Micromonospora sp. 050-3]|uniref:hypothetical protein n=1 Tax=Micromonospora sp. 050-3 TaxID=2789265 RepID=UPI00397E6544
MWLAIKAELGAIKFPIEVRHVLDKGCHEALRAGSTAGRGFALRRRAGSVSMPSSRNAALLAMSAGRIILERIDPYKGNLSAVLDGPTTEPLDLDASINICEVAGPVAAAMDRVARVQLCSAGALMA